ncbi:MAG: FtsW/RodA/SpoVE family cell cycle protein [Propionibacteriaceae bacterium]|jgi:cell division protein FtsW (lipid II flippase)|nr:FtsW/RodA/SpoVE family cell cycle protein [Propionibacteriaceae bacterium]
MAESAYTYRKRGFAQLVLILVGQSIGFAGYILTSLFSANVLPSNWLLVAICWYGLGVGLHIGVRIALPWSDPIILPITLALTGIGLAMLARLDLGSQDGAMLPTQFAAVAVGVVALVLIAFLLKDPRRLKGFPFLLSAAGFVLLLLPLVPGLGTSNYGSRIWIHVGSYSFQPAEVAKIVLAASFAAYLADKRDVLSNAGHRILGLELPRMRDLGPIAVLWTLSLAIMLFENDLGTALLFFGMFVMMIYVATGRVSWVIIGLALFAAGGAAAIRFTSHVQRRIDFWLHPFDYPDDATQIIQAQFGLSHGGLFGSGWGKGRPNLTIFASSDMIGAALGEEIGVVGLMAIVILYALFVFRGLKAALVATDPFTKLLAAGLSFAFLLQVFAIIGGVTRLLPLTGLTTPFLSQGGSAMIADWILVAILLVISNQARQPQAEAETPAGHGVTELGEESTQIFSTRELAQIGKGATRPVQHIDVEQVRLGPGGTAPVPAVADQVTDFGGAGFWRGSEEPTVYTGSDDQTVVSSLPPQAGSESSQPGATHSPGAAATGSPANLAAPAASSPTSPTVRIAPTATAPASPATPGVDDSIPDDPFSDDFFGRGTE